MSPKSLCAILFITLTLVMAPSVMGHDWAFEGRAVVNVRSYTWQPKFAMCSSVMNGQRTTYRQRLSQDLNEDNPIAKIEMVGEHSIAGREALGIDPSTIKTFPDDCPTGTEIPQDSPLRTEFQKFGFGLPKVGVDDKGRNIAGAWAQFDSYCAANLVREEVEVVGSDNPVFPSTSGEYVLGMQWFFVNQGGRLFYDCTDLTLREGNAALGSGFVSILAQNAFWLIPAALLPVVAAAIYARKHKAESIRLSQQAGGRMSAVTAAPAVGYKSGFTAGSAVTAAPATPYKSGFSTGSAKTAKSATPYKSGLTGVADLDSANTASDSPGYRSGFTGSDGH